MTTGQIVLIAAAAVLLWVLFFRIGVRVKYEPDGFWLYLRIGAVYRPLVSPKGSGPKSAGKKQKPAKRKKPKQKKVDQLALIRALVPPALKAVRRLLGKLRVDELDLVLKVGAQDPSDAALQYGRANAVLGGLWQPMVTCLNIIDGRARVEIDFERTKPCVFLLAGLSLRVGQLLLVALIFVVHAVGVLLRNSKKTTPNP